MEQQWINSKKQDEAPASSFYNGPAGGTDGNKVNSLLGLTGPINIAAGMAAQSHNVKLVDGNSIQNAVSKEYVDADKKVLRLLNGRYELREELGKGAHGRIYAGRDKATKQQIAVKIMDKVSKNKSKYQREISLMKDMNKNLIAGFPRLIYHSSDKNYYYIVMEQLYACLKDLKDQQEERVFSLKTVTMIGLQMLQRLEAIHKFGYIHRDLKPANIMVGKNAKGDLQIIYLIDFGLTKKLSFNSQIPHGDNTNKVVGTAVYAAINAHLPGSNYFKKDDLESLMYVLCYLGTGNLPWKNLKPTDAGLDKMMKMKMKFSPYDLFSMMPIEYAQILDHIKSLPNDSPCDYRYIEGLFKQVAIALKFKVDNKFDWIINNPAANAMAASSSTQQILGTVVQASFTKQNQVPSGGGGQALMQKKSTEEQKVQGTTTPPKNRFQLSNFNQAFMGTVGMPQRNLEESIVDMANKKINGFQQNNVTMTINLNYQEKQGGDLCTPEGHKMQPSTDKPSGPAQVTTEAGQKSAEIMLQRKNMHPNASQLLQAIEESTPSPFNDPNSIMNTNQNQSFIGNSNSQSILTKGGKERKTSMNNIPQGGKQQAESVILTPQQFLIGTSQIKDQSVNSQKPKFMRQSKMNEEEKSEALVIGQVNKPGTSIKRQKGMKLVGKKKNSKRPSDNANFEGSVPLSQSHNNIVLQNRLTQLVQDGNLTQQDLTQRGQLNQEEQTINNVAQDIPAQAEAQSPLLPVNDKTPTFQQELFFRQQSHTANAIFQRQKSRAAGAQTSIQVLNPASQIGENQPNLQQLAASISQNQVQQPDGRFDINVTVNFMQNSSGAMANAGVGLDAIGGGTLGVEKNSNQQHDQQHISRQGSLMPPASGQGNILQIVLVSVNNNQSNNGTQIDRQNSNVRNVQVHITQTQGPQGISANQPQQQQTETANFTSSNQAQARKVFEDKLAYSMEPQAKSNLLQEEAKKSVPEPEPEKQEIQDIREDSSNEDHGDEEEEKEPQEIGGGGDGTLETDTKTYLEFQIGINSERKGRTLSASVRQGNLEGSGERSKLVASAYQSQRVVDAVLGLETQNIRAADGSQKLSQYIQKGNEQHRETFFSPRKFMTHSNEERMKRTVISHTQQNTNNNNRNEMDLNTLQSQRPPQSSISKVNKP